MQRRAFLSSGIALLAAPGAARADVAPSRVSLSGGLQQGSLVVGKTESKARVSFDGRKLSIGPTGLFAFGFPYDQKNASTLTAHFDDGTSESREVAPVVRQYEVQSINGLPPNYVSPPEDIQKRIKREHALVAEARARDTDVDWFAEPFEWPGRGIISGLFGSQRILNGTPSAPHFGVDIAAGEGGNIHAPANAYVALAEKFYLEGGYTLLDHGRGVFTGYFHQSSQLVKAGEKVMRGQLIGHVGHTGRATGPHLHWAMNWFQVRLDPSRSTRTPAPPKV
jgi:murein DD-endopeptidase MepM/ murein hydrolase activator NlpD